MKFTLAKRRFEIVFNWKITLFYFLLMPVLLVLGYWQLHRAEEKEQIQNLYRARQAATPTSLAVALEQDDLRYRKVFLNGHYENEHVFLLDNRIFQGHAGYEVIAPFRLLEPLVYSAGGEGQSIDTLWLNRGWVPQGVRRDQLPRVPAVISEVSVVASIHIPGKPALVLSDTPFTKSWPEVIQRVETHRMAERLMQEQWVTAFPHMLYLDEGSEGSLQRIWQPVNMKVEKHLGYALQWFSLSAALTILYLFSTIRRVNKSNRD